MLRHVEHASSARWIWRGRRERAGLAEPRGELFGVGCIERGADEPSHHRLTARRAAAVCLRTVRTRRRRSSPLRLFDACGYPGSYGAARGSLRVEWIGGSTRHHYRSTVCAVRYGVRARAHEHSPARASDHETGPQTDTTSSLQRARRSCGLFTCSATVRSVGHQRDRTVSRAWS